MLRKSIVILLALLFSLIQTEAQKGKITGKVLSSKTGEPLIGATVTLEGVKRVVKSDQNGYFSISGLEKGNYKITVTYVSYSAKTIADINLKEDEIGRAHV